MVQTGTQPATIRTRPTSTCLSNMPSASQRTVTSSLGTTRSITGIRHVMCSGNDTIPITDVHMVLDAETFTPEYSIQGNRYTIGQRWEVMGWTGPRADSTTSSDSTDGFRWYGSISATDSYLWHSDGTVTELWPKGTYPGGLMWEAAPKSQRDMIRDALRRQWAPTIISSRTYIRTPEDEREDRARRTLRRIVGEKQFLMFLKNGFVTAHNKKSGYTYQIFHRGHLTHVYKNGKCVERLCVYLKGNFPATDFVITMYLMALNNDDRIWEIGIKHGARQMLAKEKTKQPSFLEVYEQIRRAG